MRLFLLIVMTAILGALLWIEHSQAPRESITVRCPEGAQVASATPGWQCVPKTQHTDLLVNRTETAVGSGYQGALNMSPVTSRPLAWVSTGGTELGSLSVEGGRVVYRLEGKRVTRAAFYHWLDAYMLKTHGGAQ